MIRASITLLRRLIGWSLATVGALVLLAGLLGAVAVPFLPQAPLTIASGLPGGDMLPGLVLWAIIALAGLIVLLAGRRIARPRVRLTVDPAGPTVGTDPPSGR